MGVCLTMAVMLRQSRSMKKRQKINKKNTKEKERKRTRIGFGGARGLCEHTSPDVHACATTADTKYHCSQSDVIRVTTQRQKPCHHYKAHLITQ
jgi:hypothetical protein